MGCGYQVVPGNFKGNRVSGTRYRESKLKICPSDLSHNTSLAAPGQGQNFRWAGPSVPVLVATYLAYVALHGVHVHGRVGEMPL